MIPHPKSVALSPELGAHPGADTHVHRPIPRIGRVGDVGHRTSDIARVSWWSHVIAYLRRWSGDDAYERYLADHQHHGHALLSRREFYRRYLDHRAGGSRCC